MKYTPTNMFWIKKSDDSILTTTLDQWRDTGDNVWIEMVASTLQGLVSRAEMLNPERKVYAGCAVELADQTILDVEATLEFARWLNISGRGAMVRVPLEASTLCLFDAIPIDALCIEPLWPKVGVKRIQRGVLKWFESKTNKRLVLRIDPQCLHSDDVEWLRNEGWCLNSELEFVR